MKTTILTCPLFFLLLLFLCLLSFIHSNTPTECINKYLFINIFKEHHLAKHCAELETKGVGRGKNSASGEVNVKSKPESLAGSKALGHGT